MCLSIKLSVTSVEAFVLDKMKITYNTTKS